MNLWVRSQDKRILQKVDNIFLDANYENKRICTEIKFYAFLGKGDDALSEPIITQ